MIFRTFSSVLSCVALASLILSTISCTSTRESAQIQLSPTFDRDQYINPQDFGYPLSIKEIEQNPPVDSSFTPISVEGGMRRAFGQVVYPAEAQKQHIRGKVILELYIDADGNLTNIAVIQSPHKLLQEAAVEAARKWSYIPAKLNETPVASFIQIPITFRTQVQEVDVNQKKSK